MFDINFLAPFFDPFNLLTISVMSIVNYIFVPKVLVGLFGERINEELNLKILILFSITLSFIIWFYIAYNLISKDLFGLFFLTMFLMVIALSFLFSEILMTCSEIPNWSGPIPSFYNIYNRFSVNEEGTGKELFDRYVTKPEKFVRLFLPGLILSVICFILGFLMSALFILQMPLIIGLFYFILLIAALHVIEDDDIEDIIDAIIPKKKNNKIIDFQSNLYSSIFSLEYGIKFLICFGYVILGFAISIVSFIVIMKFYIDNVISSTYFTNQVNLHVMDVGNVPLLLANILFLFFICLYSAYSACYWSKKANNLMNFVDKKTRSSNKIRDNFFQAGLFLPYGTVLFFLHDSWARIVNLFLIEWYYPILGFFILVISSIIFLIVSKSINKKLMISKNIGIPFTFSIQLFVFYLFNNHLPIGYILIIISIIFFYLPDINSIISKSVDLKDIGIYITLIVLSILLLLYLSITLGRYYGIIIGGGFILLNTILYILDIAHHRRQDNK